jgi:ABC-type sugar transport system permease subunit
MPYGHLFEMLSIMPWTFLIILAALVWIKFLSPRIGILNLAREGFLDNILFKLYLKFMC